MQKMKNKFILSAIAFLALTTNQQTFAQTKSEYGGPDAVTGATAVQDDGSDSSGKKSPENRNKGKGFLNRLTIGGYGEAVYTYNIVHSSRLPPS